MSTDLSTGSTTDPNAKGWTVTQQVEREFRADSFAPVNVIRFIPVPYATAHRASQEKFGQMTYEEAEAFVKLLNASTTD